MSRDKLFHAENAHKSPKVWRHVAMALKNSVLNNADDQERLGHVFFVET